MISSTNISPHFCMLRENYPQVRISPFFPHVTAELCQRRKSTFISSRSNLNSSYPHSPPRPSSIPQQPHLTSNTPARSLQSHLVLPKPTWQVLNHFTLTLTNQAHANITTITHLSRTSTHKHPPTVLSTFSRRCKHACLVRRHTRRSQH